MSKEEKKIARKRFDEIMGVAKKHHLAKLLKNNESDDDFEVADLRYAMDSTKVENELGWTRKYDFETGIKETIDWYLSNPEWIDNILSGEYKKEYSRYLKK